MENASKALRIAAGVLIALMVIGLAVFAYNKLSDLKNTEENIKAEAQAADFNKKVEVYNRDGIYGSELLSLSNLASDYNKKEAGLKGYTAITIVVKFLAESKDSIFVKYFGTSSKYSQETITNGYENMSGDIITTGQRKILGKTIQEWSKQSEVYLRSTMSASNLGEITYYKELVNKQSEIGRKLFDLDKSNPVKYDTNGRIIQMTFTEISTK